MRAHLPCLVVVISEPRGPGDLSSFPIASRRMAPLFRASRARSGKTPRDFSLILAVGAEALPVTPSGGALFAS